MRDLADERLEALHEKLTSQGYDLEALDSFGTS